jgi:hypothetical protein
VQDFLDLCNQFLAVHAKLFGASMIFAHGFLFCKWKIFWLM